MHSEIIWPHAPQKTARNKRADWAPPQPPNPAPPRGPRIEEVSHTRPSALVLGKRYHGAHHASPRHLSSDACEARAQCMSPCMLDSLCMYICEAMPTHSTFLCLSMCGLSTARGLWLHTRIEQKVRYSVGSSRGVAVDHLCSESLHLLLDGRHFPLG